MKGMAYKKELIILSIFSVIILGIVGTYAYFTSDVSSSEGALTVNSASFSLSLDVTPVYYYNKLIPMKDELAITGYNNECVDSNEFYVCQVYEIKIANTGGTGQQERLLGVINFGLTNIQNLKYMLLDEDGNIYKEATEALNGEDLSLGNYVELEDGESQTFKLIIWLSDTGSAQNSQDANGSFNAGVTYTGVRGEDVSSMITGTIN
jgi:predicted ribosomally synthesized peptide with SipW-like signal peptide